MAVVSFYKVTALPGSPQPDALYFVENGSFAETYLTDAAGVVKLVGNSSMIGGLASSAIASALTSYTSLEIVADIAARNAISRQYNYLALVLDASADPTVTGGSALYVWDHPHTQFLKVAEYEALDVPAVDVPAVVAAALDARAAANETVSGTWDFTAGLQLNGVMLSDATVALSTADVDQVVSTFAAATYRSAKFVLQAVSGDDHQMTEVAVLHDGVTTTMVEYATLLTGSPVAQFSTDIFNGLVRLLASPYNAATSIRFFRTAIQT